MTLLDAFSGNFSFQREGPHGAAMDIENIQEDADDLHEAEDPQQEQDVGDSANGIQEVEDNEDEDDEDEEDDDDEDDEDDDDAGGFENAPAGDEQDDILQEDEQQFQYQPISLIDDLKVGATYLLVSNNSEVMYTFINCNYLVSIN